MKERKKAGKQPHSCAMVPCPVYRKWGSDYCFIWPRQLCGKKPCKLARHQ